MSRCRKKQTDYTQNTLFGKMSMEPLVQTEDETSPPFSKAWLEGQYLYPSMVNGPVQVWLLDQNVRWLGGCSMPSIGESPSVAVESTLSQILQGNNVPAKYYLSSLACQGILRRAEKRGKKLPPVLEMALKAQAGQSYSSQEVKTDALESTGGGISPTLNTMQGGQRQPCVAQPIKGTEYLTGWDCQEKRIFTDRGIAPTISGSDGGGGRTGVGYIAQCATTRTGRRYDPETETLIIAGFKQGNSAEAGSVGYEVEKSPTLTAGQSGTNLVPAIVYPDPAATLRARGKTKNSNPAGQPLDNLALIPVLADQGGSQISVSYDLAPTLRAQEHGHQPLVMAFGPGGQHEIAHTIRAQASRADEPVCEPIAPTIPARERGGGGLGTDFDCDGGPIAYAVDCRNMCEAEDKSATLQAGRHGYAPDAINPVRTGYAVRRLTPLECERLQGLPEIKIHVIINLEDYSVEVSRCLDHQSPNVRNAEKKCHKLQKPAGIAERIELQQFVQFAGRNMSTKSLQTKELAHLNVHINLEGVNMPKTPSGEPLSSANAVKKKQSAPHLNPIESFVQLIAGITTTLEKTMLLGKEELLPKEPHLMVVENGKIVLNDFGKELTLLAKDAGTNIHTIKNHLKPIISGLSDLKPIEQDLIILFCCVMNVITGFTQAKTLKRITFETEKGWTNIPGASDTARYNAIGNGLAIPCPEWILGRVTEVMRREEGVKLTAFPSPPPRK